MSQGTEVGIYNDITNEWMLRAQCNGDTCLYHNGTAKLQTASYGSYTHGCHCASTCLKSPIICASTAVCATCFKGDGAGLTNIAGYSIATAMAYGNALS